MRPFHLVNAFSLKPFGGNPAAVLLLEQEEWPEEHWLQGVAAQFNLSETAFLLRRSELRYALRWFTPTTEVDLCGHATLAAAHVLWSEGRATALAELYFETASGELRCTQEPGGAMAMDFPAPPIVSIPIPELAERALGVPIVAAYADSRYLVLELANESAVRTLRPELALLRSLEQWGIVVTAVAAPSEGDDYVARFFAPNMGIPEDPVTGTAHCRLARLWSARLGKTVLTARQLSSRGGAVRVELRGSRVLLGGRAITVACGQLLI